MEKLLWGLVGLSLVGCGGAEPRIRRQEASDHLSIPPITQERLQECVKEHGHQLEQGSWAFSPTVQVDRDGGVIEVDAGAIPQSAHDLAACTRIALQDMTVPSPVFNLRAAQSDPAKNEVAPDQRMLVGNPAVVVVVVVGLSELVFEAGAYTILFAVTVKVVDKAKDDVVEALRRRRRWENDCQKKLSECLLSSLGSLWGDVHGTSRCVMCFKKCGESGWPSRIQIDDDAFATCNYLGN